MPHLVDTDILIDLTRDNQGSIEFIDSLENAWSISAITGLELIAGAKNKREVSEIGVLLAAYSTHHMTEAIERRAFELLLAYAKSHGLRTLDSLIAATAIEEGLTLATRNRKHFEMIAGLALDVPGY